MQRHGSLIQPLEFLIQRRACLNRRHGFLNRPRGCKKRRAYRNPLHACPIFHGLANRPRSRVLIQRRSGLNVYRSVRESGTQKEKEEP